MNKLGRTKSNDPKQEHLRQSKDNFNKLVKHFITTLIEYKRAINGRGSNTLGIPISTIKEPLPQEVSSLLLELSSIYQSIAQHAEEIIGEQHQYSETRRKPAEQKIATASKKIGKILISNRQFDTELAIKSEEQERGLMYSEEPRIMSFVYSRPNITKMWMKNTPMPLDVIFSANGKITNICFGEPYSLKLIGNDNPSDLVIEMPAGTCESLGITIGDSVKLEY